MPETDFVPAAGRRGLTALYDPVVALTMRERTFRRKLLEQVAENAPTRILEIGCGTGSLTVPLAERFPEAQVVGLDPDDGALARARAKDPGGRVDWREGSATELAMPDGSFDCVIASLVLHHLRMSEKRTALAEARRVLRPGGRLQVADWGEPQDLLMAGAFLALRTLDGFERTRAQARGELPELIAQAGFAAVRRGARLRTGWGTLELLSAEVEAQT
jgi:ubiquinone/menaquinone biosynthesis C-methylase UbiE